jgi:hypothetical protein
MARKHRHSASPLRASCLAFVATLRAQDILVSCWMVAADPILSLTPRVLRLGFAVCRTLRKGD